MNAHESLKGREKEGSEIAGNIQENDTFTSAPRMSIETWILRLQQIMFILLLMETLQKVILRLKF